MQGTFTKSAVPETGSDADADAGGGDGGDGGSDVGGEAAGEAAGNGKVSGVSWRVHARARERERTVPNSMVLVQAQSPRAPSSRRFASKSKRRRWRSRRSQALLRWVDFGEPVVLASLLNLCLVHHVLATANIPPVAFQDHQTIFSRKVDMNL